MKEIKNLSKPIVCKNCKHAVLRTPSNEFTSDNLYPYWYCNFLNMVCECAKNACKNK